MHRLIYVKNVSFSNFNFSSSRNFCWSCGNFFNPPATSSTTVTSRRLLSTTLNADIAKTLKKPKKRKQNKQKVELIEATGTSLSNKKATVKNLASQSLADFLDDSIKSTAENLTNVADSKTSLNQNVIVNLGPAVDEVVEEAPLLFVENFSTNDHGRSLKDIVDSYRVFKEMSLGEDKHVNDQLSPGNEEIQQLEEEIVAPVKKLKRKSKKKKEQVEDKVTEYKSKKHNTLDDEKSAKQKSMLIHLAPYVEMCNETNNTNRGLETLLFYRKKYKEFKPNVRLCNMLLSGFAEKGNLPKVTEVLNIMKEVNVELNAPSYAAIFECLGRLGEAQQRLKLIKKFHDEAIAKGISMNDVMNLSTFTGHKRNIVVEVIQQIEPEFQPIYTPPELKYKNCLLDEMNKSIQPIEGNRFQDNGSEILNGKRNFTLQEYKQMLHEQLQIESTGTIQIKSIEKFNEADENVLYYRSKVEDHRKVWHEAICHGFKRELKSLGSQSIYKGRGRISIVPYLNLFTVEKYADILLHDIRVLTEGSETFSQSIKWLYARIGRKVQDIYFMERKKHNGVLEKTVEIYEQYYRTLCEGRSSDNCRQMWQRLVHQNRQSGASMDIVDNAWPLPICIDIGCFLYQVLLKDVKIDTKVMRRGNNKANYMPAFYTIFRAEGIRIQEEMKPHPVLSQLYRASQQETLTFDSNLIPMLCPPQPWSTPNNGGYILGRSDLVRLPSQAYQQLDRINATDTVNLYPALDSLNQLASVAWKCDTKILDVVLEVFRNGGSHEFGVSQPPSALEFHETESDDSFNKKEKYELFRAKAAHSQKQGEMFSLWCDLLYRLSLANHYRDKIFWLPHNMDFRGRVYPIPPHLNHLGADLARSLLVFHQAKPLGADGFAWLKLHCINLTGQKKRDSVENRLKYAEEIMDEIVDSADNPLTGRKWWVQSDEPWQTLAACVEITKVLRSPDPTKFLSSFPIHQDGSCNGLQHYAAIGRDSSGAISVNLYPSSVPQDVYSDVAELVEKLRKRDADEGVAIASILEGYVKRKVIKQTVMTTVYGVTRYGAREQIAKQLKAIDSFPKESVWQASSYLTTKTFESLSEMFTSTKQIQDWLTNSARLIASVAGQNVEWITPLGLPIVQPYSQAKNGAHNGLTSVKMDLFTKPNVVKQKNAFPPNFIHSLDSSHMMLTSLHCERAGLTFMSVHDCYWTHACTVPDMNKFCREQFVALHSQPILEDLAKFLAEKYRFSSDDFQNDKQKLKELKLDFNETLRQLPPERGNFDLKNVLDSTYFFS